MPSWSGTVGWSIVPCTERLLVHFLVRTHTKGNQLMPLPLSLSLSSDEDYKNNKKEVLSEWCTVRIVECQKKKKQPLLVEDGTGMNNVTKKWRLKERSGREMAYNKVYN